VQAAPRRLQGSTVQRSERAQGERPGRHAPMVQWSECCSFKAAMRVRFPLGVRGAAAGPRSREEAGQPGAPCGLATVFELAL
jgi:hypothetical protein